VSVFARCCPTGRPSRIVTRLQSGVEAAETPTRYRHGEHDIE
jgi:hypothetical protein